MLSPDDVAALAEATGERYRAMVWLGGVLGWRWEALTTVSGWASPQGSLRAVQSRALSAAERYLDHLRAGLLADE